ncbi:hypothetical protein BSPA111_14750 [Buttiauxella sp. A111]|nr:hypothetical protein BSPA111_14750 [Buttiauxella sp. A111]
MDVRVGQQPLGGNINAITQHTISQVDNQVGVFMPIHGEGNFIADSGIPGDRAMNRSLRMMGFGNIDNVICRNVIDGDVVMERDGVDLCFSRADCRAA